MFSRLREDIAAVQERDPAATSAASVLINYPGVQAICAHRFEHFLWNCGRRGIARFLSQCTRFFTGVEIHPAARFGRRVFIDHGMGVIVGETAVVGNDVTLFQGVTLGGTGKEQGKRHPNIEDGAIIGVGAAVLGNITVGARTKVGGGAVVVDNVPADCTVVGVPGHVVVQNGIRICPADPFRRELLPDPVEEQLLALTARVTELETHSLALPPGTSNAELARLSARLDTLEAELDALVAAQHIAQGASEKHRSQAGKNKGKMKKDKHKPKKNGSVACGHRGIPASQQTNLNGDGDARL
ncbi:MAG: serine O-acetyltransferase [Coriobacteriales bacterium]|nr:serine O-acetyltransferase [Coriobacteriales bacterium]